jgi:hypothetical protein
MRFWTLCMLMSDGSEAKKSTPGYQECFFAIWRNRFLVFMKYNPADVERLVRAEWARYERGEYHQWHYGREWGKAYVWEGDGDG